MTSTSLRNNFVEINGEKVPFFEKMRLKFNPLTQVEDEDGNKVQLKKKVPAISNSTIGGSFKLPELALHRKENQVFNKLEDPNNDEIQFV